MTSRLVAALIQEARLLVPRERHAEAEGFDGRDVAVAIHRPDLEAMLAARHLPQRRALSTGRNPDQAPPSRRYEEEQPIGQRVLPAIDAAEGDVDVAVGRRLRGVRPGQDGARRVAVGGRIVEAQSPAGAGPHPAAAVLEHR